MATDLLFALLPIPMLWNVQLNKKTKAAIAGILSLGILYVSNSIFLIIVPAFCRLLSNLEYSATVAAIVKITFLSNYGKHGDFLFDSVDITIWCVSLFSDKTPSIAILSLFGDKC